MNRFGPALVAFAIAAAIVSRGPLLAEFLVQLRDPNLFGGAVFSAILTHFGYACVLAVCAVLAGCAVLVAAWRARLRGTTDWHATLVAALVALCMSGRAGLTLDPIGWLCAASCALLLERDDDSSGYQLIAVMVLWSALQGGATLGALLVLCAFIGKLTDDGAFDASFRKRALQYVAAMLIGVLQLHAWPWHGYGAHALYLDALKAGAQRDRLWNGNITAPAIGFSAILVVAAWYGLRRRGRMTDSVTFFALLVLTLLDARMLPYFGIVTAPIVVDALASYYVLARSRPRGTVRSYSPGVLALCVAFIAAIVVTEPKVAIWPPAFGQPAPLIAYLKTHPRPARVLCTHPRWCDGLAYVVPHARAVADDRTGITPRDALHVQAAVANALPRWSTLLQTDRIDTVIASDDDSVAALLVARGWHVRASYDMQVLLQP